MRLPDGATLPLAEWVGQTDAGRAARLTVTAPTPAPVAVAAAPVAPPAPADDDE